LRFLDLHASNVHQHTFNQSREATLLRDYDLNPLGSRPSAKFARMQDLDLEQILSVWLTYVSDNVKARVLQRI